MIIELQGHEIELHERSYGVVGYIDGDSEPYIFTKEESQILINDGQIKSIIN